MDKETGTEKLNIYAKGGQLVEGGVEVKPGTNACGAWGLRGGPAHLGSRL